MNGDEYDAASPGVTLTGKSSSEASSPGAPPRSRPADGARRIRSVAAIVFDDAGRLLLIQRGHPPAQGLWSIPGGKVEPGESDQEAVIREVAEETGLTVVPGALAGSVERAGSSGTVYEIYDYDAVLAPDSARSHGGATGAGPGRAASDAADLRWVAPEDLEALPLTDGLVEALRSWGRLP